MQHLKCEQRRILNRREELVNKCIHRRKHLLGMVNTSILSSEHVRSDITPNQLVEPQQIELQQIDSQATVIGSIQQESQHKNPVTWGSTRSGHIWRKNTVQIVSQQDPG